MTKLEELCIELEMLIKDMEESDKVMDRMLKEIIEVIK